MLFQKSVLFLILSRICVCTPVKLVSATYARGQNRTDTSFDYVVIGGGTAGLVIASRLTQASYSVAVVEAGGFYEQDIGDIGKVPAFAVYGAGASSGDVIASVDWGFITTPQAGLNNRKLHYARGKTLGGSSARNYFTYQRPTIDSLNKWATLVDDATYNFEAFLPFYKRSINYTAPINSIRPINASVPSATSAFTVGSGPLHVSFSDQWVNPISSFFKRAWETLGLPVANDFVSGALSGVQYVANTIDPNGNVRDSSYTFVKGLPGFTTLEIYNNTLAKRILFDQKRAKGVLVSDNIGEFTLMAEKEVILSAGVFQSPQLLMVSGIGPKEVLKQFDLDTISELEGVGQNLEDHLLFGASYHVEPLTHSALSNVTYFTESAREYAESGGGILGNPGGEIIAWEKLSAESVQSLSTPVHEVLKSVPADWPHFEYLMLDAYSGDNQNYIEGAPRTPFMYASPAASIMVPQSRGNITIASADTAEPPIINPNWLANSFDQELSLMAFKRLRTMMDTDDMKRAWTAEVLPGRNITSDEGIMNVVRSTAIQMFHASCTCRMGKSPESGAVIDSRARVFGTKSLRVVDASSMPFLPPGHPQSTIYALAEKIAADIINTNR